MSLFRWISWLNPNHTPRVEWVGWALGGGTVLNDQRLPDIQAGILINPLLPTQRGVTLAISDGMIWATLPDTSSYFHSIPASATDAHAYAEALVTEMLVERGYLPRGEQS